MAKYSVVVGGFVTVFRSRKLTIYANDMDEAELKAIDKFILIQSERGDCDDATVDCIEEI